jgi:hypothetical protein
MKRILLASLAIASLATLGACSGATIEKAEANPMPYDTKEGPGLLSGNTGDIFEGIMEQSGYGKGARGPSANVNAHMWRATLEALSFMPLTQADSAGGAILTDWYTTPSKLTERVKVNVLILGQSLRAENLKVSMFKQVRKNNMWVDMQVSKKTTARLAETILTNARVLKVKEAASN